MFPYTSVGQLAPASVPSVSSSALTPAQIAFNAAVQRVQALQAQIDAQNRLLNDLANQEGDARNKPDFGVTLANVQRQQVLQRQTLLGLQQQLAAAQQEQERLRNDLPVRTPRSPSTGPFVSTHFPPGTTFSGGLTPALAETFATQRDIAVAQGNTARVVEIDNILSTRVHPPSVTAVNAPPVGDNGQPIGSGGAQKYLVPARVIGAALLAGGFLYTRACSTRRAA